MEIDFGLGPFSVTAVGERTTSMFSHFDTVMNTISS